MDPFSGLALGVTFAAVGFYVMYLVVRAAVRDGIRDARDREPGDAGRS
ncbi:hypothetical protein CLV46_0708 [Diaminobutyricimonas aerilata]|uniref:Uncharacterized protein n=1 Tax=Diaminobutyricimonas aerilata TaxID=1162967 RepID=A0A2M9CGW5_9MICO|nr:hypothetical protein [Diaminobutyricimonas aerilata]PJJ71166.1 hypothetical protein CLV46_0708 [Diaminobutyricimonas aerilata]